MLPAMWKSNQITVLIYDAVCLISLLKDFCCLMHKRFIATRIFIRQLKLVFFLQSNKMQSHSYGTTDIGMSIHDVISF